MMSKTQDIRWVQRYQNFSKACKLLSEIDAYKAEETPAIIKEGFIHRFEIVFDLLWKTARDYLEHEGISVQPTPRAVIKEAFAAGIISNGQVCIEMLEARNLMAHKYDEETFGTVFLRIQGQFYPAIEELRAFLEGKQA